MKRVGISGGENIFSSPGVYAWGSGDRNNLSLLQESVGKISLCTSPCSPCLRGASFLKQFQHGDHGAYTEKFDFPDRLLQESVGKIP